MNNKAFRVAVEVQQSIIKMHEACRLERLNRYGRLAEDVETFANLISLCQRALHKKWYLAAERIQRRLTSCVSDLWYALQSSKQVSAQLPPVPSLRTLIAELEQLDTELGPYEFDRGNKRLSIITEDIELEEVVLGPFRIELDLRQMVNGSHDSPYACVATEPNPASGNISTTHPHVTDNRLCEGDGKMPIRRALEQGRICDFFMLVVNILKTYNPESAYIRLDDWSGEQCYDCGDSIHGDDVYYCRNCDYEYCSYCSSYCRICDETCCLGCGGECAGCGDFVCPRCVAACVECKKKYCVNCLEEQMCPECRERKQANEEESDEDGSEGNEVEQGAGIAETVQTPGRVLPAVQPDGVGQVAVLPGQEPQ